MLFNLLQEGLHVGVRRIDQSVEAIQFLAPFGVGERVHLEHLGEHVAAHRAFRRSLGMGEGCRAAIVVDDPDAFPGDGRDHLRRMRGQNPLNPGEGRLQRPCNGLLPVRVQMQVDFVHDVMPGVCATSKSGIPLFRRQLRRAMSPPMPSMVLMPSLWLPTGSVGWSAAPASSVCSAAEYSHSVSPTGAGTADSTPTRKSQSILAVVPDAGFRRSWEMAAAHSPKDWNSTRGSRQSR